MIKTRLGTTLSSNFRLCPATRTRMADTAVIQQLGEALENVVPRIPLSVIRSLVGDDAVSARTVAETTKHPLESLSQEEIENATNMIPREILIREYSVCEEKLSKIMLIYQQTMDAVFTTYDTGYRLYKVCTRNVLVDIESLYRLVVTLKNALEKQKWKVADTSGALELYLEIHGQDKTTFPDLVLMSRSTTNLTKDEVTSLTRVYLNMGIPAAMNVCAFVTKLIIDDTRLTERQKVNVPNTQFIQHLEDMTTVIKIMTEFMLKDWDLKALHPSIHELISRQQVKLMDISGSTPKP